jgi:hypothetical protein
MAIGLEQTNHIGKVQNAASQKLLDDQVLAADNGDLKAELGCWQRYAALNRLLMELCRRQQLINLYFDHKFRWLVNELHETHVADASGRSGAFGTNAFVGKAFDYIPGERLPDGNQNVNIASKSRMFPGAHCDAAQDRHRSVERFERLPDPPESFQDRASRTASGGIAVLP